MLDDARGKRLSAAVGDDRQPAIAQPSGQKFTISVVNLSYLGESNDSCTSGFHPGLIAGSGGGDLVPRNSRPTPRGISGGISGTRNFGDTILISKPLTRPTPVRHGAR